MTAVYFVSFLFFRGIWFGGPNRYTGVSTPWIRLRELLRCNLFTIRELALQKLKNKTFHLGDISNTQPHSSLKHLLITLPVLTDPM